jgi:hypothetical protein
MATMATMAAFTALAALAALAFTIVIVAARNTLADISHAVSLDRDSRWTPIFDRARILSRAAALTYRARTLSSAAAVLSTPCPYSLLCMRSAAAMLSGSTGKFGVGMATRALHSLASSSLLTTPRLPLVQVGCFIGPAIEGIEGFDDLAGLAGWQGCIYRAQPPSGAREHWRFSRPSLCG